LSQDPNLNFTGFQYQNKKTDFRGPKGVLGETQVVSAVQFVTQTTPKSGKTTARAAEKGNIITGQDKAGE
jgi:hypothetical protein